MLIYILVVVACFGAIAFSQIEFPGTETEIEDVAVEILEREGVHVTVDKTGKVSKDVGDASKGDETK